MNLLKNMVLLLIASIICVAFLEFASRVLKLHGDTDPTYYLSDPVLPFLMKPNSQGKSIYGKILRINNHGLRGPDIDLFKDIDKKRILILGDSVTFGYCLDYEDTFSGILEKQLVSSKKFQGEVINAGHIGFNIKDSANYYKIYGNKFNPDIIIIAVNRSDNTSQSLDYLIKDGISYSKNSKWIFIPPFIKNILRKSSLYMTIGLVKARIEYRKVIAQSVDASTSMIDSVKIDLKNLKKHAINFDTPLWIVAVPNERDVIKGEYQEKFLDDLRKYSEKLNIPFIDTLQDFKKDQQNYCLNDQAHPSKVGHSIIANNLYEKVLNYFVIN
jgi:lysophospholipase L1-like esterase|tara:strand:- start:1455 stop:2438 length:984 start_codon:yes stop_codon:yes gene_type:complete